MLLTITYTGRNTTDLGYLLYKNPCRPQMFELNHGKAYVFYPEASDERTTAALLLDINPVDLARGKAGTKGGGLFDYLSDRPYVSSSFMSTAISRVFGTALTGRADSRQALSDSALDLTATVSMLPCHGEQNNLNSVFAPLGYKVCYETFITDEKFPGWGESRYVNLNISGKVRLRDLLKHLYVLIPVFDRRKHYWVGEDEIEKLLTMGEDWLPGHPEKEFITRRYLYRRRALANMALERLSAANAADGEMLEAEPDEADEKPAKEPVLNERRLGSVVAALKNRGVKRVIDIGCGEGNLLNLLVRERRFTSIAGVDVSPAALERASAKLRIERAGDAMRERVRLFQGSLMYKDARFAGYDAACVVEVIEHLDIPRLAAFERVLFGFAKPPLVVVTTPNKEYNAHYGLIDTVNTTPKDDLRHLRGLRHGDHRFEWTRAEFRDWANRIADKFGYAAQFSDIGDPDETCGAPTQMGVFTLCE
ncbi:MAG: 3' terminal RNA ribose 2'-O-methyltransferase Hen1 [Planctomycetes bacterium]|nr:3' terminal RNA ribose 2'-O-methyltransferase Hen1 [Planctomycetota bacterium]